MSGESIGRAPRVRRLPVAPPGALLSPASFFAGSGKVRFPESRDGEVCKCAGRVTPISLSVCPRGPTAANPVYLTHGPQRYNTRHSLSFIPFDYFIPTRSAGYAARGSREIRDLYRSTYEKKARGIDKFWAIKARMTRPAVPSMLGEFLYSLLFRPFSEQK